MQQRDHAPIPSSKPDKFETAIDPMRYRRIRWFFARVFFHVLWWDIFLNLPVLRLFRTPPIGRWRGIARNYRKLAVQMGGVLIKLGQFLSIRVDILPPEVTSELSGLQDQVPAESMEKVVQMIESEFGRPISKVFSRISEECLGAASLAQAHEVVLPDGQTAVVKVLRPGIGRIVETDLQAISAAFRWLKLYKRIKEHVDLDWLVREFTSTTRRELDLKAEAESARRLARDFEGKSVIYIPEIFWKYCTSSILTLENVDYIKIVDREAMIAAGIDPARVADALYDIYMRQVFEKFFVHADPHPGNLFVLPLPTDGERSRGIARFFPKEPVPHRPNRPFRIAFVDFGMMAEIPPRIRDAIREYAIGLGTRDAHKMVKACVDAGALLPDADMDRIEAAHEVLFSRLWGVRVGQFRSLALSEARYFMREFKDVIFDAPFQFQADMLFVVRAIGILSGLATHLNPSFDPWSKTIPYAERFTREKQPQGFTEWRQELEVTAHRLLALPEQLEKIAILAGRGKLSMKTSFSADSKKQIHRMIHAIDQLKWMVFAAALLIAGVVRNARDNDSLLGWALMAISGAVIFYALKKPTD